MKVMQLISAKAPLLYATSSGLYPLVTDPGPSEAGCAGKMWCWSWPSPCFWLVTPLSREDGMSVRPPLCPISHRQSGIAWPLESAAGSLLLLSAATWPGLRPPHRGRKPRYGPWRPVPPAETPSLQSLWPVVPPESGGGLRTTLHQR